MKQWYAIEYYDKSVWEKIARQSMEQKGACVGSWGVS